MKQPDIVIVMIGGKIIGIFAKDEYHNLNVKVLDYDETPDASDDVLEDMIEIPFE